MLALIYAGSFWLPALSRLMNIPFWRELSSPVQNAFGIGVAVTGLVGVFSSRMIYRIFFFVCHATDCLRRL
jgi:hypothetical protein